jgi:hypothetical protein
MEGVIEEEDVGNDVSVFHAKASLARSWHHFKTSIHFLDSFIPSIFTTA